MSEDKELRNILASIGEEPSEKEKKADDQPAEKTLAAKPDADGPLPPEELAVAVEAALRTVYDPEIPVNIYDLGLIYDVVIDDFGNVAIEMTLTTPGCPVAQTFPDDIKRVVEAVDYVAEASVEVVWDPPWTMDMMSEAAKLQLGVI